VLLREGIASLLQGTRYKVVAAAARPAELSAACCPKGQPVLIVVGIDLQNASLDQAAASIRLLRSTIPDAKLVLVADSDKAVDLQRVPVLSFHACIFSLCSRDTLIKALELTFMNQHVCVFAQSVATAAKEHIDFVGPPPALPPAASPEFRNSSNLSPRESQVLTSVAEGKSNKLIARVCRISEATVKVHLKAILRKTKAHNRTQAAIWAIRHGFRDSPNNGIAIESNGCAVTQSPALASISQTVTIQNAASPQSQTHLTPPARCASAAPAARTR
jgi:two-component system nitrate/nitrite response regulator NarL